jgi:voltage-gated potassium channel
MKINELDHINSKTFLSYYHFDQKEDYSKFITMLYYTITTLATIGFGDYCPRADEERMFTVCVFLIGVSVFSYLMGVFIEIIKKFQLLNVDLDEGD